jgi:hypothetical protein
MCIPINMIMEVSSGRLVTNHNGRERYSQRGSKIIWLSEPITLIPDDNKIYEIKYSSGKCFEGIIKQVGEDEIGFYMILSVVGYNLRNDISIIHKRIQLGEATLIEVFNDENIPGFKDLTKRLGEPWRFGLSSIVDFQRINGDICISVRGGALNDVIIKLELRDVIEEVHFSNECFDINYFKNTWISKFFIRKKDKLGYVIFFGYIGDNHRFLESQQYDFENEEYFIEDCETTARIRCSEINISHYNCFLKEMEQKDYACISSDKYKSDSLNGDKLRNQWLYAFANNIDISKIYTEDHLWHIFSYKRLQCIEKEEATKKFNEIRKKSIYIFFDYSDVCYLLKNAESFSLEDVSYYKGNDIYITNEDFTWTYVITHEVGWLGPYFYSHEQIEKTENKLV